MSRTNNKSKKTAQGGNKSSSSGGKKKTSSQKREASKQKLVRAEAVRRREQSRSDRERYAKEYNNSGDRRANKAHERSHTRQERVRQPTGVKARWAVTNNAEREASGSKALPGAMTTDCRHCSGATLRYMATVADPTLDMTLAHPTVNPAEIAGMVSMQRFKSVFVVSCSSSSAPALSWCVISPAWGGPYADRNMALYTGNLYTGNIIATGAGGVVPFKWLTSPYDALGSIPGDLMYRVTGCVVRIRNTTPALYRGGSIVLYEEPSHSIEGLKARDFANVASLPGASVYDLDIEGGDYFEIVWHPKGMAVNAQHSARPGFSAALSGNGPFAAFHTAANSIVDEHIFSELCFLVKNPSIGSVLQPQTLEVTVHAIYELKGREIRAKSLFNREAIGSANVDAAMTDLSATSGNLDDSKTWHDQTAGPISEEVTRYISTVAEIATAAVPAAMDVLALLGAL